MKILYGIQGTGNGHLSRAMEIIPALQKKGEVDILISGIQVDLSLPYPVKYRFNGLSFIFGKKGGVDVLSTYFKLKSRKLAQEIRSLPIEQYDLIINDFEPVSAWAAYFKKKPCIALSNQCAVFSKNAPRPNHRDRLGEMILKYYAPSTAEYGLHFAKFDASLYTPVIRKQVRETDVTNDGHYTVYLPAYDDERLIKSLSRFRDIKWEVFSKHNREEIRHHNIHIRPISNHAFLQSLASCEGVISGAGFGATSEALYLKKKLLVVPMKTQYEQHCNTAALATLGIPSVRSLKKKHKHCIEEWIQHGKPAEVHYPDITGEIIDHIIEDHHSNRHMPLTYSWGQRKEKSMGVR